MATASSPKARGMVFSRPMWSETQPQIGRQIPLITRSRLSANGNASTVQPRMVTGALSTLKSLAIGASWAVAIKPPVATMVIMEVHEPEMGCRGHFRRGEGDRRLARPHFVAASGPPGLGQPASRRRLEKRRGDDDDHALDDAPAGEGRLVPRRGDHVGNGSHVDGRP